MLGSRSRPTRPECLLSEDRGMRSRQPLVVFAVAFSIAVLVASGLPAGAADAPRRGGVLLAVIAADAPSLDPHQEETFATLELVDRKSVV